MVLTSSECRIMHSLKTMHDAWESKRETKSNYALTIHNYALTLWL